jgi:hypothetical protein
VQQMPGRDVYLDGLLEGLFPRPRTEPQYMLATRGFAATAAFIKRQFEQTPTPTLLARAGPKSGAAYASPCAAPFGPQKNLSRLRLSKQGTSVGDAVICLV